NDGDPYRGTGLIREILEIGADRLNPDNPNAAVYINISSLARKDFLRYIEEFSDKVNVSKVGPALRVPLKIRTITGSWRQWLIDEGGLERVSDAIPGEQAYWHTIQVYKLQPKHVSSSSVFMPSKIIVEIDARALAKTYGTISRVPEEFWQWLAGMGVNVIWFKGAWRKSRLSAAMMRHWQKNSKETIKRWASAYDVQDYILDTTFASSDDEYLKVAHILQDKFSISTILDFVTNHFAADAFVVKRKKDKVVIAWNDFYEALETARRIPGMPGNLREKEFKKWLRAKYDRSFYRVSPWHLSPWYNVIVKNAWYGVNGFGPEAHMPNLAQVNYILPSCREYMIKVITDIIGRLTLNGGFRADLAFYALRAQFWNTWGYPLGLSWEDFDRLWPKEFWREAMDKASANGMIAVAESYDVGDKENSPWLGRAGCLQDSGIVVYEKGLYDRVKRQSADSVRNYIFDSAPKTFHDMSIHFSENHDEEPFRDINGFGDYALGASALMYSVPGYVLVTLRQLIGAIYDDRHFMGYPMFDGPCRIGMKSPDAGIYEFSYPDILENGTLIDKQFETIIREISLPLYRQGDFAYANIEAPVINGSSIVPIVRYFEGELGVVIVNHRGPETEDVVIDPNTIGMYLNSKVKPIISNNLWENFIVSEGVKVKTSDGKIFVSVPSKGYAILHFKGESLEKSDENSSSSSINNRLYSIAIVTYKYKAFSRVLIIQLALNERQDSQATSSVAGWGLVPAVNLLYDDTQSAKASSGIVFIEFIRRLEALSGSLDKSVSSLYLISRVLDKNVQIASVLGFANGEFGRLYAFFLDYNDYIKNYCLALKARAHLVKVIDKQNLSDFQIFSFGKNIALLIEGLEKTRMIVMSYLPFLFEDELKKIADDNKNFTDEIILAITTAKDILGLLQPLYVYEVREEVLKALSVASKMREDAKMIWLPFEPGLNISMTIPAMMGIARGFIKNDPPVLKQSVSFLSKVLNEYDKLIDDLILRMSDVTPDKAVALNQALRFLAQSRERVVYAVNAIESYTAKRRGASSSIERTGVYFISLAENMHFVDKTMRYLSRYIDILKEHWRRGNSDHYIDMTGDAPIGLSIPEDESDNNFYITVNGAERLVFSRDVNGFAAYETDIPVFLKINERKEIIAVSILLDDNNNFLNLEVKRGKEKYSSAVDPARLLLSPFQDLPIAFDELYVYARIVTGDSIVSSSPADSSLAERVKNVILSARYDSLENVLLDVINSEGPDHERLLRLLGFNGPQLVNINARPANMFGQKVVSIDALLSIRKVGDATVNNAIGFLKS
ncbi:MAG: hypothetical protein PHZ27_05270, partial [Candidatus Omnitrophica bacterium]|nr:hypothetical protein [Candidatus Omnitrophota bacterium]